MYKCAKCKQTIGPRISACEAIIEIEQLYKTVEIAKGKETYIQHIPKGSKIKKTETRCYPCYVENKEKVKKIKDKILARK